MDNSINSRPIKHSAYASVLIDKGHIKIGTPYYQKLVNECNSTDKFINQLILFFADGQKHDFYMQKMLLQFSCDICLKHRISSRSISFILDLFLTKYFSGIPHVLT